MTASFQLSLTGEQKNSLMCLLAWEKATPRVPPICNEDLAAIEKQLEGTCDSNEPGPGMAAALIKSLLPITEYDEKGLGTTPEADVLLESFRTAFGDGSFTLLTCLLAHMHNHLKHEAEALFGLESEEEAD